MHRRHLYTAAGTTALTAALLACGPPPPPAPIKASAVQYIVIADTPAQRAWCIAHPGGALQWDPQHRLICRIVP